MTTSDVRVPEPTPVVVEHTMLLFLAIGREVMKKKIAKEFSLAGNPNCHAVARGYAMMFPHLEVVDGAVPLWSKGGPRAAFHSWLRFKQHPKFGVDVSPLGALPYFTYPNLLYFDEYSIFYEMPIPSASLEGSSQEAEVFTKAIGPIIRSFSSREQKTV